MINLCLYSRELSIYSAYKFFICCTRQPRPQWTGWPVDSWVSAAYEKAHAPPFAGSATHSSWLALHDPLRCRFQSEYAVSSRCLSLGTCSRWIGNLAPMRQTRRTRRQVQGSRRISSTHFCYICTLCPSQEKNRQLGLNHWKVHWSQSPLCYVYVSALLPWECSRILAEYLSSFSNKWRQSAALRSCVGGESWKTSSFGRSKSFRRAGIGACRTHSSVWSKCVCKRNQTSYSTSLPPHFHLVTFLLPPLRRGLIS